MVVAFPDEAKLLGGSFPSLPATVLAFERELHVVIVGHFHHDQTAWHSYTSGVGFRDPAPGPSALELALLCLHAHHRLVERRHHHAAPDSATRDGRPGYVATAVLRRPVGHAPDLVRDEP